MDRQIKFTYLADITKEFVKELNKQMNSFHEKQFIVSDVDFIFFLRLISQTAIFIEWIIVCTVPKF